MSKKPNTGCGCGCLSAVLLALVGLPALGWWIEGRVRSTTPSTHVAHQHTPEATTPSTPVPPSTSVPSTTVPPPTPPPGNTPSTWPPPSTTARTSSSAQRSSSATHTPSSRQVAPIDDPFYVGYCAPSPERSRPKYSKLAGAQTALKGRVVLVHLLVDAPGVRWTEVDRDRVNTTAFAVAKLYQREAQRYGVELDLTTVPWPITTSIAIPNLTPGERDVLSDATARALEDAVRKGLQQAEQETLAHVEREYKEQGYDHVAFIAYLPAVSSARSFANAHGNRDPTPGLAFVFDSGSVVAMASVAAHEGLHLFGADDLYRLYPGDPADDHDIMSACRGFQGNGIAEATAWAIGWEREPPARAYRF
jgi:hypothetical protein